MLWVGELSAYEHFFIEKQFSCGYVESLPYTVDGKSESGEFRVDASGTERGKAAQRQARANLRFRLSIFEEENGAVALEDSDLVSVNVRGDAIRDGHCL